MHLGASVSGTQLGGSSPVLRIPSEGVLLVGVKLSEVQDVLDILVGPGIPGMLDVPEIAGILEVLGPQGVEGIESKHGLANDPLTEVAPLFSSSPLGHSGRSVGGAAGWGAESAAEWAELTLC